MCSNLKGFTQSDSSKSGLRFPIQDRNTDFYSTKPSTTIDLKDPKIITQKVEYDPKTNKFIVYEKIGDTYYKAPTYMTYDEYLQYSSQQSEQTYFLNGEPDPDYSFLPINGDAIGVIQQIPYALNNIFLFLKIHS